MDYRTKNCLDADHGHVTPGTAVVEFKCHTAGGSAPNPALDSQEWYSYVDSKGNADGTIINSKSGLCLGVSAGIKGSLPAGRLQLEICLSNPQVKAPDQVWVHTTYLDPSVSIRRVSPANAPVTNLDVDHASKSPGAPVVMYQATGSSQQSWSYLINPDGTLTFINMNSNECLDIATNNKYPAGIPNSTGGANVIQNNCRVAKPSQKWFNIGDVGSAMYMNATSIISGKPMCIDPINGSYVNDTHVQISPCNYSLSQQKFEITANQ